PKMRGQGGRFVHQIEASFAETRADVWVFAAGAHGFVVAASFQNDGLAKKGITAVEKLRIADEVWAPLLRHACLTPAVGHGALHSLYQSAACAGDFGVFQMRQERSKPGWTGDAVRVKRRNQLIARGPKRRVPATGHAFVDRMANDGHTWIFCGNLA